MGVQFYIINIRVTKNNLDNRSNRDYFTGYADNTGVKFFWKQYQPFYIHISHNIIEFIIVNLKIP